MVMVSNEEDRDYVNAVVYSELVAGQIRDESRARFVAVISKMGEPGAQGAILGCTETVAGQ